MRRLIVAILTVTFPVMNPSADAATGRVVKVLTHYLDLKGRHSTSPSLYDRDAYQAQLRKHPEQRSGLRFEVLWRGRAEAGSKLQLRAELRGTAKGNLPSQKTLETEVKIGKSGATTRWNSLTLAGDDYREFGDVTAWRVTLWNGGQLVAEQKSFLW